MTNVFVATYEHRHGKVHFAFMAAQAIINKMEH